MSLAIVSSTGWSAAFFERPAQLTTLLITPPAANQHEVARLRKLPNEYA